MRGEVLPCTEQPRVVWVTRAAMLDLGFDHQSSRGCGWEVMEDLSGLTFCW